MAKPDGTATNTVKLGPFKTGYNNIDDEVDLPDGAVRTAENVDIDRKGWFRRRPGFTKIYFGFGIHSLWNRYFVESGTLKFLTYQNTAVDIVSGLSDNRLSYTEANGKIYFTNEDEIGTVAGAFGVDDPAHTPTLTASSGGLDAGTYQISIAYVNINGEQGGATNPVLIDVGDSGGIDVANIPQSTEGSKVTVFVSEPNGSELYSQVMLNTGVVSYTIGALGKKGILLDTQFMKRLLPGQFITQFKGRMYIASGSTLWYSEAQRPHLYSPASGFFNFKARITVLAETENGIFVVADKTYFLSGTDPKKMQLSIVGNATGIEGTGISVDSSIFNLEYNGKIAYWFGSEGAMLGLPDGSIKYLTQDRIAPVTAASGCTGFKEVNGLRQLISNLNEQDTVNNVGAADVATAQVIRNGIVI